MAAAAGQALPVVPEVLCPAVIFLMLLVLPAVLILGATEAVCRMAAAAAAADTLAAAEELTDGEVPMVAAAMAEVAML